MHTRVRQQTSRLAEIIFRRYLHAKRTVRNVDLAKFALLMRKTAEASGFARISSAKFMAFGESDRDISQTSQPSWRRSVPDSTAQGV
jgi:hypothetical protein